MQHHLNLHKPFLSPATVIFNMMLLICASFGFVASVFLLVGLSIDCRQLLLPWIVTMVADDFVEATHFLYVVSFEKVDMLSAILVLINSVKFHDITFYFPNQFFFIVVARV